MVTAGKTAHVTIDMFATHTRVFSWEELKDDFNELKNANGKLKNLEEIEIINTELTASEIKIDNAPTLKVNKTITLWSKTDVTIKRMDFSPNTSIDATVFTIEKGTLILDGTKGGTITIDGNGRDNTNCQRALINVMENGTLKMLNGVTLTNNHTANYGGGVYVEENGRFYMEGGTISENRAAHKGGGVYVDDRKSPKNGIFVKSGGIIEKNSADEQGGGDAVYDKGDRWNDPLRSDNPWPLRK